MNKLTIEYKQEEVDTLEALELIGKIKEVFGESAKVDQEFDNGWLIQAIDEAYDSIDKHSYQPEDIERLKKCLGVT